MLRVFSDVGREAAPKCILMTPSSQLAELDHKLGQFLLNLAVLDRKGSDWEYILLGISCFQE